jgi:hypothetical protein
VLRGPKGIWAGGAFTEGHRLDTAIAALIPAKEIGRPLSQADARKLLGRIGGERR